VYQNTDPFCTFCKIRGYKTRDGFCHLFRDCSTTENIKSRIEVLLEGETGPLHYWFGVVNEKINVGELIKWETFRYVIWKNKQRRRLPNVGMIINEMCTVLQIMCNLNRNIGFDLNDLLTRCKQALG